MSLRILVVEDYSDAAESSALFLGMLGHDVRLAATCAEALSAAAEFDPDVVLLDIGLPDGDGYALAGRLVAALSRRPAVVALTGYPDLAGRSREAGLDAHLVKPVDPLHLASVLDGLAARPGRAGLPAGSVCD